MIMGQKHVNSLKETMPTPSQEHVEKDDLLPANKWNRAHKRKTDRRPLEPVKRIYAKIIFKKRKVSWKPEEIGLHPSHFQEITPL
jgi:hypothetical protein